MRPSVTSTATIFVLSIIVICCNTQNSNAAFNMATFTDVLQAGKDITTGAVSKLPNLIPSPESLLQMGKNVIAGYPFKVAFDAINKLCSVALSSDSINPKFNPDYTKMTFLLMTPTKNYSFPLMNSEEMWKSPAFDKNKNTTILVTGWTTDLNETNGAIYTLSNAYFCRGNVNFVVVDTARYVDTLYTWSAFNTEDLGFYIGQALISFLSYADYERTHLIGHSLGAHIVGAAGRTFGYITGKLLPHITGLDPAKPCFNEGETLSGLQRGDADFIDVVHSNPGALGKETSVGDIDFYPGGLSPLPVGCLSISCAHARAWEYYAETVYPGNEYNFLAVKCTSLNKLRTGKCPGSEIPMGYAVPFKARGNYFLEVNGEPPFGKNATMNTTIHCNS